MHGLCRDKTRQLFAEALLLAREAAPDADVGAAAAEAESAMHRQNDGVNQRYKAKYRSLIFNLKDANNPDLRRRVLSGEITGAPLPGNLPFYWPAAPHNGCAEEVMQTLANIKMHSRSTSGHTVQRGLFLVGSRQGRKSGGICWHLMGMCAQVTCW